MKSLLRLLRSGFWDDKSLSRGRIAPVRFAKFTNKTYQMRLGPNNVEFRVGFRTDNSLPEARRQRLSFFKKSESDNTRQLSWRMSNGLLLQQEGEKQVRREVA